MAETSDGTAGTRPYGSAYDLPSFQELSRQIQGMSVLTRFVARGRHAEVAELRRNLDGLANQVDEFYALLGERNWIYHDGLPSSEVRALLDRSGDDAAGAERELIKLYQEGEWLGFWATRLRGRSGFAERDQQIARALAHYNAGVFDSCTLHLIAVMDGFVNDFEPAVRKGLAARDFDEMVAWDSVVGHHMGLTHAMKAFRKTCKKRVDSEVFEVHRHGIVHGTVVNFDNPIVATKAWSMLFSVADWAAATQRAAEPSEPAPTLRSTLATVWRHAKAESDRERFRPSVVSVDDPAFDDLAVVIRARAFLEAWKKERWGIVTEAFSEQTVGRHNTCGQQIEWVKSIYEFNPLSAFEMEEVEFPQASVAVIRGRATIGEQRGPVELRWLYWRPDESLAMPGDADAEWYIGIYAPHAMMRGGGGD